MFGPERAGQMVFDTPLLGKGAWGGLRSYVCLTQTASILCKQHILSNLCLRICCRRFGERYRSGRKGKKSPPHYTPGRGRSLLSLSPYVCVLGGRAFGPPLCRGCAPATPPSKTIAHRPCVRIPAVPLQQRGCRKPNTQSDSQNGGSDKELVKTDTVDGLVVTRWAKRLMRRSHLKN